MSLTTNISVKPLITCHWGVWLRVPGVSGNRYSCPWIMKTIRLSFCTCSLLKEQGGICVWQGSCLTEQTTVFQWAYIHLRHRKQAQGANKTHHHIQILLLARFLDATATWRGKREIDNETFSVAVSCSRVDDWKVDYKAKFRSVWISMNNYMWGENNDP